MTLKDIGIWYFEIGWLIATIIGIFIAVVATMLQRAWILWTWLVLVGAFGFLMIWAKHN